MRPATGNRLYEGLLTIGIEQPRQLNFSPQLRAAMDVLHNPELSRPEFRNVNPGDRITAINGLPVKREDYPVLYRAMQYAAIEFIPMTTNGNAQRLRFQISQMP